MSVGVVSLATAGFNLVSDLVVRRQETKLARKALNAKVATNRIEGSTKVALSDNDYELIAKANEHKSWLNNYVTIIFTLPIILHFLGILVFAFIGDNRLLESAGDMIDEMNKLRLDQGYGLFLAIIVAAAVGRKWRNMQSKI